LAGTSQSGAEADPNPPPPPIPPTLADAIAALVNATTDNARVMREVLQNQNGARIPPNNARNASYMELGICSCVATDGTYARIDHYLVFL
jgi:hypothetical protein